jgi:choline dehydrogenase-like flavoprotein
MLPYFKKTETHHTTSHGEEQHGFNGPMQTNTHTSAGRKYPLRALVKQAWEEIGVKEITDINAGSPLGMGELIDNRRDGLRQPASSVYRLSGVQVLTETLVQRIVIEEREGRKVATGVELADGRMLVAKKEVILSAGAYRTPQVLMLSGIGENEELSQHGIKQVVDLPDVGRNLHDHLLSTYGNIPQSRNSSMLMD